MKQIQQVEYVVGRNPAVSLSVVVEFDDLSTTATFQWTLLDADGGYVAGGPVICSGSDYTNWNGDNQYPYTYVAANLSTPITLTGN